MAKFIHICNNCEYWYCADMAGVCRRYPPQPSRTPNRKGVFPITSSTQWCGEFRLKEKYRRVLMKEIIEDMS